MIFFLIVGCILLSYGLAIILGKHQITFTNPILAMGFGFVLMALLDAYIPSILKFIVLLFLFHAIICMMVISFKAKHATMQVPEIIFVFGAGLIENRLSRSLKVRLDHAYELALKYEKCPIIVSGGQGKNEWMSEAQAMKDYLVSLGINEERVLMEDKSKTTQENLVLSMRLYDLKNKKIALVSNQFHVYRTELMARKLGLDGFSSPAYLHHIGTFAFYIREYLACIKAFLKQEI